MNEHNNPNRSPNGQKPKKPRSSNSGGGGGSRLNFGSSPVAGGGGGSRLNFGSSPVAEGDPAAKALFSSPGGGGKTLGFGEEPLTPPAGGGGGGGRKLSPLSKTPVKMETFPRIDDLVGLSPFLDDEDHIKSIDPKNRKYCVQIQNETGEIREVAFGEPDGGLYHPDREKTWLKEIPAIYERPTEEGVYTWIVYTTADDISTLKFVCKRTYSLYEVGSRHEAIANSIDGIHAVYAAGELEVLPSVNITFNLSSGSYMLSVFKPFTSNKGEIDAKRAKYITMFQTLIPGATPTASDDERSSLLLRHIYAPIPHNIAEIYEAIGVTFEPCSNASSSAAAAASKNRSRRRKTHRRNSRKRRQTRRRCNQA